MVRYYQNRELSQKLEVKLAKWKRWSREFLPPDPLGGLQSGYARQYNVNDAFSVYLGGYLVSELKFSIPEAKQILSDLKEWMRSHHFYASLNDVNGKKNGLTEPTNPCRIYIFVVKDHDRKTYRILYRIKRVVTAGPSVLNGESVDLEQTVAKPVDNNMKLYKNDTKTVGLFTAWGSRVVHITELYHHFLDRLAKSRAH
jgi:hypothetical protein